MCKASPVLQTGLADRMRFRGFRTACIEEDKSHRSGSFRLHDDLQPVDDLTGFQFLQINDGDAQLGGPVAGGGVADLRGDDGRLGAFTAEAVPEDGQLVQGLRLDVAGLQLKNRGITPRAAMTSISLETLPWPSTSSHRTTALLITSWKMAESTQAL